MESKCSHGIAWKAHCLACDVNERADLEKMRPYFKEVLDRAKRADSNSDLKAAIVHTKEVAVRMQGTPCGTEHVQLAAWLSELYLRRLAGEIGREDI